jgi:hypothetical protein
LKGHWFQPFTLPHLVYSKFAFGRFQLVPALRGGSFDAKLEICFAVADVDEVRRLSEQQASAFISQDAAVVAFAAA